MIRDFLVFETRKNLDLRKILVTPKIFLKSRFHCTKLGIFLPESEIPVFFETIIGPIVTK